jgi:hypothetical protein
VGAYAAGSSYFPRRPKFQPADVEKKTKQLDELLDELYPKEMERKPSSALEITIDQLIDLVKLTSSEASGNGLWDDKRIVTALETLREDDSYQNRAYLIVRRNRNLNPSNDPNDPNKAMQIRAVLSGGTSGEQGQLRSLANTKYPTLYMLRVKGTKWAGVPFWIPNVLFPNGQYALMFNFQ